MFCLRRDLQSIISVQGTSILSGKKVKNRGKDWKMQSFDRSNLKFYMSLLYEDRNYYAMKKNSEPLLSTCLGQKNLAVCKVNWLRIWDLQTFSRLQ